MDFFRHLEVQAMHIPREYKRQDCEELFAFLFRAASFLLAFFFVALRLIVECVAGLFLECVQECQSISRREIIHVKH